MRSAAPLDWQGHLPLSEHATRSCTPCTGRSPHLENRGRDWRLQLRDDGSSGRLFLPTPYLEAQQESCKAERLSVSVKRARDCLNCRDLRLPARRIHRVSLGPKRDYLGVSTVGCQICKNAPSGRALMAASSAEQRSPHTPSSGWVGCPFPQSSRVLPPISSRD